MKTFDLSVSPRDFNENRKLEEADIVHYIAQLFILAFKELSGETLSLVDFDKFKMAQFLFDKDKIGLIKYIREISHADIRIPIHIPLGLAPEFDKLPNTINLNYRGAIALKPAKDIADLLSYNYNFIINLQGETK